jgi:hypothetical protein
MLGGDRLGRFCKKNVYLYGMKTHFIRSVTDLNKNPYFERENEARLSW